MEVRLPEVVKNAQEGHRVHVCVSMFVCVCVYTHAPDNPNSCSPPRQSSLLPFQPNLSSVEAHYLIFTDALC